MAAACLIGGAWFGYWARGPRIEPAHAPQPPNLRSVVARSKGGVVGVRCVLQPSVTPSVREGSGFAVHGDGLIVTCAHLVTDRMLVVVEVPDRGRFLADVVGEDDVTDLAVLRLRDAPDLALDTLEFADSDDVHPGDWVLAVGYPMTLGHTVTAGLVSSRGRHLPLDDARISASYLQFSAAVNAGSSGSPVLDLSGKVVGMTTSKCKDGEGLAFAVPSRTVEWVLARMEEHGGCVPRGYLGVSLAPGRADGDGARVHQVDRDGPGWLAGIRPGDVVVSFGGQKVTDAEDLYDKITQALPTTEVSVDVRSERRAATRRLVAVLTEARPSAERGPDLPGELPSELQGDPPERSGTTGNRTGD